jgi:hypothetical protein
VRGRGRTRGIGRREVVGSTGTSGSESHPKLFRQDQFGALDGG